MSSVIRFFYHPSQKKLLSLAIPMVFSSITTPLLGLIDTGIVGHLGKAWFLSGVAMGSTIVTILFFVLVFLRMATVGLTGQAYGANLIDKQVLVLGQGILLALIISALILVFQKIIITQSLSLMSGSEQSLFYAHQYLSIRIYHAPATLINYVFIGWLIGRQNVKLPMMMILVTNIVNIGLDLLFVVVFKWQVVGVAWASLIAEYSATILAVVCLARYWLLYKLPPISLKALFLERAQFKLYFMSSRDIFLRSLCLQFVFTFFTIQSSRFSDVTLAANSILLNLLMLVAFIVGGFSTTAESIASHRLGQNNKEMFKTELTLIAIWCLLLALFLMVFLWLSNQFMLNMLTNVQSVIDEAHRYLPWLLCICLIAAWSYFLDGLFIGIAQTTPMRNGMFIAVCGYLVTWFLTLNWANDGLWFAFFIFMCLRSLSLSYFFIRLWQNKALFTK